MKCVIKKKWTSWAACAPSPSNILSFLPSFIPFNHYFLLTSLSLSLPYDVCALNDGWDACVHSIIPFSLPPFVLFFPSSWRVCTYVGKDKWSSRPVLYLSFFLNTFPSFFPLLLPYNAALLPSQRPSFLPFYPFLNLSTLPFLFFLSSIPYRL